MAIDVVKFYDRFKVFSHGKRGYLEQLIRLEEPFLYDYLVRMCGDKERARLTTLNAIRKLRNSRYIWKNQSELRVSLYRSCRRSCLDIWDMNTSELVHPFLDMFYGREEKLSVIKNWELKHRLNRCLNSIPAIEKEVILLKSRSSFTFSEIREIRRMTYYEVEEFYSYGFKSLKEDMGSYHENLRFLVSDLPCYPIVETHKVIKSLSQYYIWMKNNLSSLYTHLQSYLKSLRKRP